MDCLIHGARELSIAAHKEKRSRRRMPAIDQARTCSVKTLHVVVPLPMIGGAQLVPAIVASTANSSVSRMRPPRQRHHDDRGRAGIV